MNIKTVVVVFISVFLLSEAIAETNGCYEYAQRKEYDRAIEACSPYTANFSSSGTPGVTIRHSRPDKQASRGKTKITVTVMHGNA